MRTILTKITLLCAALFLYADVASAANIGVFNIQLIMTQSEVAIAAERVLQEQFGSETDSLEASANSLQAAIAEYQRQAAVLSESAQQEREAEFEAQAAAFEERRVALGNEIAPIQQAMQMELFEIVGIACQSYGAANEFDIIMEGSQVVTYISPSVDITQGLILEVNKVWEERGATFTSQQ